MLVSMQIKRKSRKQEERTAKDFGGRTQIASGAIDGMKADVKTGVRSIGFNDNDFLIENKYTDNASYSLKKSIWEKIENESLRDNLRIPLMQIDIQDKELVVLNKSDFLSLIGKD
jgi:hypothetical protein